MTVVKEIITVRGAALLKIMVIDGIITVADKNPIFTRQTKGSGIVSLKTDRAFMIKTLSSMLTGEEVLYSPIFGCLQQGGLSPYNYFGFFGLTDKELLIALLNPLNGKRIDWYNRVPLDIKAVNIHRAILPKQYVVKIKFNGGNPCKIRMSQWLLSGGFVEQEQNVTTFIERLKLYAG